jgi:short-subunit dehydrogenase
MASVQHKVVAITGASTGIGRELANQLARRGAKLLLAARSRGALEETRAGCAAVGADAACETADVTEPNDCRRVIQAAVDRFGRLDILVNNAGMSMYAPFEQITDLGVFARLMEVNLLGAVYCTHFALPYLKQSRGLLAAISSLQGKTGFPNSTAYAASKHAMQGFFDSLRIELADNGVDVLLVSPGPVATSIHTRRLDGAGTMSTDGPVRPVEKCMPVEECARQILVAIERRKRELLMTMAGKMGPWMKLLAPRWTDRMVANAVRDFYEEA